MTEPFRCQLISWHQVYRLSLRIADQIHKQFLQPELIVAIGRGGYTPARILCDALQIDSLTSIALTHYLPGAAQAGKVRIKYPLRVNIHRRCVLLVDDVNDSGDTLTFATDYLRSWSPASLKVAVLHHKTIATYHPDFIGARVLKWRWLIYPWALREDIGAFIDRMDPPPKNLAEAARRLHEGYGVRLAESVLAPIFSAR